MSLARSYRKCAFSGQLLFDDDPFVTLDGPDGQLRFADDEHRRAYVEGWTIDECADRLTAWRRPPPGPMPEDVDPVTLETTANALAFVARQMGDTMARTAYSPIFAEALDFSTAIFDDRLEMLAHHAYSPNHIGSLRYCVPLGIRRIGAARLVPGDVVIHNDPQCGTPHLPEVSVTRPVFEDGRIRYYVATIAHQTDVGGKAAGSMPGDARDIYQEGLVIPPTRLFAGGAAQEAVFAMILANVRSPHLLYGDLRAMCGSLETGERGIRALAARMGWDGLARYGEELKAHAERRFRAELARMPKGTFHGEAMVDDDGVSEGPHHIRVALRIEEGRVLADFRGSSPQSPGSINCAYSVGLQVAINAILQMLCSRTLNNWGLQRCFHHVAPPGTILNVDHPGAFNGGQTETSNLIFEAMLNAVAEVAPHLVPAPSASTVCLVTGAASDPRTGEVASFITWDNAGSGAFHDRDGLSSMSRPGGTTARNYPTEVLETAFPWRTLSLGLREGSGGAGRFRGGLGLVREAELDADVLDFGFNANRGIFAPQGRSGGGPSALTRLSVQRTGSEDWQNPAEFGGFRSPDKFSGARMARGDVMRTETPGGGGWGSARTRPRADVEEDLKQGYIDRDEAVGTYGLDPARADEILARYRWRPA